MRVDDVDTPLADVDLTLLLKALVPLVPEFDLVIELVLLELLTLLTFAILLLALANLVLLIAVNP